jgi:excisionase family DNA binding protein
MMATDIEALVDRAQAVRGRLKAQGATEDAAVVEQLIREIAARPAERAERPYYTVSEAAELVGVSGQTIKNWAKRGIIQAYRLGGRIVIPRAELDFYRPLAEAARAIEPIGTDEEIIELIRAGRRKFVWPVPTEQEQAVQSSVGYICSDWIVPTRACLSRQPGTL